MPLSSEPWLLEFLDGGCPRPFAIDIEVDTATSVFLSFAACVAIFAEGIDGKIGGGSVFVDVYDDVVCPSHER